MSVRDAAFKAARELDFKIISDGCFGASSITASDVDHMVESREQFLFIEGKGPTLGMKTGQRRALLALSKKPGITVLVIGGEEPNAPTVMQAYRDGVALPSRSCSLADVRAFIGRWFADTLVGA